MDDIGMPANKGLGALGWTRRGAADRDGRPSALLGRLIGLYDHAMDYETDLSRLGDVRARMNLFRTLAIWVDGSPKKVRNAWASICSDYPGTGKADMADPSVDIADVERWRDFERTYLSRADRLRDTVMPLWGWEIRDVASGLGFPLKELSLITHWSVLMGDDVWAVLCDARRHLETLEGHDIALSFTRENYDPVFAAPFRDEFTDAWKTEEDRLISIPRNARAKEYKA